MKVAGDHSVALPSAPESSEIIFSLQPCEASPARSHGAARREVCDPSPALGRRNGQRGLDAEIAETAPSFDVQGNYAGGHELSVERLFP